MRAEIAIPPAKPAAPASHSRRSIIANTGGIERQFQPFRFITLSASPLFDRHQYW
jgi:hypothetical protein